ncbi:MAG TPA: YciI family protein [Gaiellaceae bacterium]|jgi:uncharacterized protein YciI|nr:YciI family protein [Gaiellaceae bacterium]
MEFAYLVRPAFDRAFLASATPDQREVFDRHGSYLERLHAEGRVLFAGRCWDGPFGIVVLEVGNEDEARTIVAEDPSVRLGIQSAELYPFNVFLR